jgi:hypothetical protein
MVPPYRVTQVQVARIGGCTDHGATNRTSGGTQGRITGGRANRCTTGGA